MIENIDRLSYAIIVATTMHADQKDKAGQPYILHPLAVMQNALHYYTITKEPLPDGISLEDLLIALVLHDTVEDTPMTLERIGQEFGPVVRDIVDGVTRRRTAVKLADLDVSKTQPISETYMQFIRRAKQHPGSRIAKRFDLLHNLSRIDQLPPEQRDIAKRYERALKELEA